MRIVNMAVILTVAVAAIVLVGAAQEDPCMTCHTDQTYNGTSPHDIVIDSGTIVHGDIYEQTKPTISRSTTKRPKSYNSIESDVDSYTDATRACITCHNDTARNETGYVMDTDGNDVNASYRRPHNDTMMCEYCHGSNPHTIQYIQPDGTLGYNPLTAATCIDCHQTGTVPANNNNFATAYVIGNILRHSNDPNNGSIWSRVDEGVFWNNQYSACIYCHDDTKHDSRTISIPFGAQIVPQTALGLPYDFKDNNNVRMFGTWCLSCHYKGYNLYSTMTETMNPVPPEITRDPTYGTYSTPKYYDHSYVGTLNDAKCKTCHGNRPNVSALMHDTTSGEGGPNCISCHEVSLGGDLPHINISAMNRVDSIHKDLNKDATTLLDPENKKCWSCHGDGTEPSKHPERYKTPAVCAECHVTGTNKNFTPDNTIKMVTEHYWNGDQIRTTGVSSCYQCHNKSEMMIVANDPDIGSGAVYGGDNGGNNSTSHYGKKRSDMIEGTSPYCNYCHNVSISPGSFFDVFVDIYNKDIQNHSRYATNPKCQDCHGPGRIHDTGLTFNELTLPTSTICLDCHGPGGTASIKDKSKHNNAVECSVCHLGTGKDIHPIKYLDNTGGFTLDKAQGVKCDKCHETGLYGAPSIGKVQHSNNPSNGSLWNAGRPSIFWNSNIPSSSCNYCHGDTKHKTDAIGKPTSFKGTNSVNVFGDWCGLCHYKDNSQYSNMVGATNPLVPPEISRHSTYGSYATASDGTPYFNHVLGSYADTRCDDCHYAGPSSSLTQVMHNVAIGGTSCIGCHSEDVDTAKFGRHIDVSRTEGTGIISDNDCKGCHFNVLTLGQMLPGYASYENTYYCQDCHKSGGRNPTQYVVIPANLKVDTLVHAKNDCQSCHINNNAGKYHPGGPKGTAFDTTNNIDRNCYSCHYNSNGIRDGGANVGIMNGPFRAPGEDHKCDGNCHNGIYAGFERPPLTSCSMCHGTASDHNVVKGGYHYGGETTLIDQITVTSPVSAGTTSTLRARVFQRWVQIAKANYRIMSGSTVIRDWQPMNAEDGAFNSRQEYITANIDTAGLNGDYTIEFRAMDSGHTAEYGEIAHSSSIPYYPDNGVWSKISSKPLTVTGGGPTPTPTPVPTVSDIGIYRSGTWYFDINRDGSTDSWTAFGGVPGDIPVIGDWNGNGVSDIGIYRSGTWYFDINRDGSTDSWTAFGGVPGDIPVIGDWNGNGVSDIGIYRSGTWYFDINRDGSTDSWTAFGGVPGDIPVIGDWN